LAEKAHILASDAINATRLDATPLAESDIYVLREGVGSTLADCVRRYWGGKTQYLDAATSEVLLTVRFDDGSAPANGDVKFGACIITSPYRWGFMGIRFPLATREEVAREAAELSQD